MEPQLLVNVFCKYVTILRSGMPASAAANAMVFQQFVQLAKSGVIKPVAALSNVLKARHQMQLELHVSVLAQLQQMDVEQTKFGTLRLAAANAQLRLLPALLPNF